MGNGETIRVPVNQSKIATFALLALLVAIPAEAGLQMKGKLVEYVVSNCQRPDTKTDAGEQACSALYDYDPDCDFEPGGGGRWSIISRSGDDLSLRIKLSGLTAGCEGEILRPYAYLESVAGACNGAPCFTSFQADRTTCVVTDGSCAIEASFPDTAGINLFGTVYLDVRRGDNGDWVTFVSGLRQ